MSFLHHFQDRNQDPIKWYQSTNIMGATNQDTIAGKRIEAVEEKLGLMQDQLQAISTQLQNRGTDMKYVKDKMEELSSAMAKLLELNSTGKPQGRGGAKTPNSGILTPTDDSFARNKGAMPPPPLGFNSEKLVVETRSQGGRLGQHEELISKHQADCATEPLATMKQGMYHYSDSIRGSDSDLSGGKGIGIVLVSDEEDDGGCGILGGGFGMCGGSSISEGLSHIFERDGGNDGNDISGCGVQHNLHGEGAIPDVFSIKKEIRELMLAPRFIIKTTLMPWVKETGPNPTINRPLTVMPQRLNPMTHFTINYSVSLVFSCAHKVLDECLEPNLVIQWVLTISYVVWGRKPLKPPDYVYFFVAYEDDIDRFASISEIALDYGGGYCKCINCMGNLIYLSVISTNQTAFLRDNYSASLIVVDEEICQMKVGNRQDFKRNQGLQLDAGIGPLCKIMSNKTQTNFLYLWGRCHSSKNESGTRAHKSVNLKSNFNFKYDNSGIKEDDDYRSINGDSGIQSLLTKQAVECESSGTTFPHDNICGLAMRPTMSLNDHAQKPYTEDGGNISTKQIAMKIEVPNKHKDSKITRKSVVGRHVDMPLKLQERDFDGNPYVPVYVLLHLGAINLKCEVGEPDNLFHQLMVFKSIDGVMVDCWSGVVKALILQVQPKLLLGVRKNTGDNQDELEVLNGWHTVTAIEATWEDYDQTNMQFSDFHLEDKVKVWDAGIDKPQPILVYQRRNKKKAHTNGPTTKASRDGPTNVVRTRMSIASALIFGSVFWRMGKSQTSIQDRMGLLQVAAINTAMAALTKTVGVFPKERAIVDRERAKGCYMLGPYLLSKLIAEIPIGAAFPLLFGTILYPMARLHPTLSRFGKFSGIVTVESFAASAMGLTVGAMAPTSEAALALGPSLMTVFIVFGGYYVNADNTPIIFRWIPRVSLIRWAFQGLCINEFKGLEFDHEKSFDIQSGEQALAKLSFGDSNITETVMAQSRILAFWYFTTYLLLEKNKPRYQPLEPPPPAVVNQTEEELEPVESDESSPGQSFEILETPAVEQEQGKPDPSSGQLSMFDLDGF